MCAEHFHLILVLSFPFLKRSKYPIPYPQSQPRYATLPPTYHQPYCTGANLSAGTRTILAFLFQPLVFPTSSKPLPSLSLTPFPNLSQQPLPSPGSIPCATNPNPNSAKACMPWQSFVPMMYN